MAAERRIVVAGAGIAGLTAAIAFATRGFFVDLFERAPELTEIGAGLQLSPNATRILERLGVLPLLSATAVKPRAVVLRRAADLREIGRVPLGDWAERRWKAPYLTIHRADLQAALLARASRQDGIRITTGAAVTGLAFGSGAVAAVEKNGQVQHVKAQLVVGADGVWSTLRQLTGATAGSRFSGQVAWRRTLPADDPSVQALEISGRSAREGGTHVVGAYLSGGFHLVAYPVRAGSAVNLAAFTPGADRGQGWSQRIDAAALRRAMARSAAPLRTLADGDGWTSWPVHTVDAGGWFDRHGLALIGDAAHAMTPFAAQGAAMAIEDAETLAQAVAYSADLPSALAAWQARRQARVGRVARRGALNQLAWHAWGPAAAARDLLLRARSPESLAADLDWLYGHAE